MAGRITVTAEFMADFKTVSQFYGWDSHEEAEIRSQIRENFSELSLWITETAIILRWAFETWMRLPRPEWCRGYLASRGIFYEDETIFQRCGILVLVRLCAEAAGVLPAACLTSDSMASR